MFTTAGMTEARNSEVKIEDVPRAVFADLLRFVYTGRCPVDNLQPLAVAADKYDLGPLRAWCERKLSKSVAADTAGSLLVLADVHRLSALKAYVLDFTVE
eukprot:TRINITY_DN1888_c0_g1_i4.p2 TRINITY_DN1888_c0_g1~~TRINITY_DN1888_c0_g1_i4.p2  ORF type:complete len:100 (-),score=43.01 TRINITY_DN1888_c0_g1_i4:130-429(-)